MKKEEDKYVIMYNSDQIDKDRKSLRIFMWIAIVSAIFWFGLIAFRIITGQ